MDIPLSARRHRLSLAVAVLALAALASCSLPRAGSRTCRVSLETAPEEGAVAYLVPWTDWRSAVGDGSLDEVLAAQPDFLQPYRVHASPTPVTVVIRPYTFVFVAEKGGRRVHGDRFLALDGSKVVLTLGGS